MIAFLSLFLGLVTGSQPVAVAVEGPVAAVEIVMDGRPLARIEGAPWVSEVDFGSDLAPHELVARALDARGEEIARARQWLNLPRPPAEAVIVLERNAKGRAVAARLSWSSVSVELPIASSVTFDGKPLLLDNPARIPLPAYDPDTTHVISADLTFTQVIRARTDVVLDAGVVGETRTELTAVAVRVEKGEKLPPAERLAGWFVKGSEALRVTAVEEEAAQVFLVRDLVTGKAVEKKLGSGGLRIYAPRRLRDIPVSGSEGRRFEMALRKKDRLRIVWPISRQSVGAGILANLFESSRELRPEEGGMHWLLTGVTHPGGDVEPKRFTDAVAVAGLEATGAYARRAVVLVLGSGQDRSHYPPAGVRSYLASINVPLFVWSLTGESPSTSAWEAEDISSLDKLRKAFGRFRKELDAQKIVWIEGRHLPQEIALSEKAKGLEIVR